VLERERAGDWQCRRGAPQEPRERDLRRGRAVAVGDLVELPAPDTAEREERNEHDPLAGAVVEDVVVLAFRQAVVVLNRGDRQDLAGSLDLLDADLREADVPDLAPVVVLLDGSQAVLERSLGIDSVKVVERDRLRSEPPKALFDLSPKDVGATVSGAPAALGRDNDTVAERRQRGADGFFTLAARVRMCAVDMPEPGGDGFLRERHVLARIRESIGAEADSGHHRVTQPDFQRVHPEQDCANVLRPRRPAASRWLRIALDTVGFVAEECVLDLAGREITVTSPHKVFFPERGETKLDLVRYYLAVAEPLMRAAGDRPTLMQRFPHGAEGSSFFQKRVPETAPEWLRTTIVSTPNGTTARALVLADMAHVVWAVNLACLGFHLWPYVHHRPEVVDELRLDLDPQPGVEFDEVRAAAGELRRLLDELGIAGYPKTTGNRGLHVYVRLEPHWDSYQVRAAAVATARELERRRPELITSAWWKEERGRRVFVDYNQNAPHKTVFGAWSVRARPGGQVSAPLTWDEIDTVHPDELTIATVPDRLSAQGDPWGGLNEQPQSLEPLLELHEQDRASGLMDAPWPPVYPKQPDEPPRVAPSRARKDPR
jgi:DNA ligase D-like protein (predicted polymerase)